MRLFKESDFEVTTTYGGSTVSIKGRFETVYIHDYKLVTELIKNLSFGVLPRNPFLKKCARNMLSSDEFNSLSQSRSGNKQRYNNRQDKRKYA